MVDIDSRQKLQNNERQILGCGAMQLRRRTKGTWHVAARENGSRPFLLIPGPFQGKDAPVSPPTRTHNALTNPDLQLQTGPKWTQMAPKKVFPGPEFHHPSCPFDKLKANRGTNSAQKMERLCCQRRRDIVCGEYRLARFSFWGRGVRLQRPPGLAQY